MQITIDTSKPLNDLDRAILALVTGVAAATETIVQEPAKVPSKAPAKKPAPAPEPEEDDEEEESESEDLIGGEPTIQDAVDRATELVGEGKQALVKAALKAVGADRVSNIPASKAGAFLAALEA